MPNETAATKTETAMVGDIDTFEISKRNDVFIVQQRTEKRGATGQRNRDAMEHMAKFNLK